MTDDRLAEIRPVHDIRASGAAWVSEAEVVWLCDQVARLEAVTNQLKREQRAADVESEMLTERYQAAEADADRLAQALEQIAELPEYLGDASDNLRRGSADDAAEIARAALAARGKP